MYSKRASDKPGRLLLAAVSVALAGTALTACNAKTTVEESQYQVDDHVTSLRIKTNGGNVEVVTADSSAVSVTERFEYADEKPRTEHSVRNGELSLNAPGCADSECVVNYTVAVPRDTNLSMDTGGGDIIVHGLSGAMDAKTGGGNVRIRESATKKLAPHTRAAATSTPPSPRRQNRSRPSRKAATSRCDYPKEPTQWMPRATAATVNWASPAIRPPHARSRRTRVAETSPSSPPAEIRLACATQRCASRSPG